MNSMNSMSNNLLKKNIIKSTTGLLTSIPAGCQGLFACKWVNNNYTGPMIRLRSSGTPTPNPCNFYMDSSGKYVGTLPNGDGTSLSTWLGANNATVVIWYDQSTFGYDVSQNTVANQPTYDKTANDVYFGSGQYFNMRSPNTMFGTGNAAYTVMYRVIKTNPLLSDVYGIFITFNSSLGNGALTITKSYFFNWFSTVVTPKINDYFICRNTPSGATSNLSSYYNSSSTPLGVSTTQVNISNTQGILGSTGNGGGVQLLFSFNYMSFWSTSLSGSDLTKMVI